MPTIGFESSLDIFANRDGFSIPISRIIPEIINIGNRKCGHLIYGLKLNKNTKEYQQLT